MDRDLPWTETTLGRDHPGQRPPWTETPLDRDPWTETTLDGDPLDRDPLDRDHPGQRPTWTETTLDRDPPGQRPPWTDIPWKEHGTRDRGPPLEGTLDQAVTRNDIIQRPPPQCEQND